MIAEDIITGFILLATVGGVDGDGIEWRPITCACTVGPLWAGGGTKFPGDNLGTFAGERAPCTTPAHVGCTGEGEAVTMQAVVGATLRGKGELETGLTVPGGIIDLTLVGGV